MRSLRDHGSETYLALPEPSSGKPPLGKYGATRPMAAPGFVWTFCEQMVGVSTCDEKRQ